LIHNKKIYAILPKKTTLKNVQCLLVPQQSLASHCTYAALNICKIQNLLMTNLMALKWHKQMTNFLVFDVRMESCYFQNKCSVSCLSFIDEKMVCDFCWMVKVSIT